MATSKKIKSIVICLIAAVAGIIALSLIFFDFDWKEQPRHIWAEIVPAIFVIVGIAVIAYVIIESLNESWPPYKLTYVIYEIAVCCVQ